MTDLKLIFAGSGAFGLPTLRALRQQVVLVVSQPDRPAGRGRRLVPTPISEFAIENNLPLLRTEQFNNEKLPPADVMVVIAFGQKISRQQADHPRLGSVNLHASLLPLFRGAAPINWTILTGQTDTGNSVIRLADRMDAGAIVGQSRLQIAATETAGELHDRLSDDGPGLMTRVLAGLGTIPEIPQDESKATRAAKLSRQDAMINWKTGAESVARKIRAFWPWPTCHVRLLDAANNEVKRLALARAKPAESEGTRWHPGEIEGSGFINAGPDAVEILELQPEGGRVMSFADYRRGHPWMPGMRLESPEK
jgi:methionyl-tRNA formyltransferase